MKRSIWVGAAIGIGALLATGCASAADPSTTAVKVPDATRAVAWAEQGSVEIMAEGDTQPTRLALPQLTDPDSVLIDWSVDGRYLFVRSQATHAASATWQWTFDTVARRLNPLPPSLPGFAGFTDDELFSYAPAAGEITTLAPVPAAVASSVASPLRLEGVAPDSDFIAALRGTRALFVNSDSVYLVDTFGFVPKVATLPATAFVDLASISPDGRTAALVYDTGTGATPGIKTATVSTATRRLSPITVPAAPKGDFTEFLTLAYDQDGELMASAVPMPLSCYSDGCAEDQARGPVQMYRLSPLGWLSTGSHAWLASADGKISVTYDSGANTNRVSVAGRHFSAPGGAFAISGLDWFAGNYVS
jgi:hypothetical protein